MTKDFSFWKYADCEDCPISSENESECPLSKKYTGYRNVLTCPYLNNNLNDDLAELMSSYRGYNSKAESFDAKASDYQYEDMFVSSAKALMWLLNALNLQEENKFLKEKIKKLERN